MRIIFAGTPEFAAVQLKALIDNDFTIELVLTQPDKPAGRGQKLTPPPVKQLAESYEIPVLQPTTLKDQSIVETLKRIKPDLMIVSAYGMLLPKTVLALPKLGCWNVHASLLPRWRGAAPIQYALLQGDHETGISLMQMDEGLDTGPVLLKKTLPITNSDTTGSLLEKLATLGAQTLLEGLTTMPLAVAQEPLATHAPKIQKEQALIDWSLTSHEIERQIRAFNPWPCAFTHIHGERVKIWGGSVLSYGQTMPLTPGTIEMISPQGLIVATRDGLLKITHLQLPGKKSMDIKALLNAHTLPWRSGDLCE